MDIATSAVRHDLTDGLHDNFSRIERRDTTVRGTAMAELEAMQPRFSQWLPGEEVPEKHWMYRLAKKYWFSDFGAYRNGDHAAAAKASVLKTRLDPARVVADNPARGEPVVK